MASAFICEEAPRALECTICNTSFLFVKVGAGRLPRFCSPECKREKLRRLSSTYRAEARTPSFQINRYELREPIEFTCQHCGKVGTTKQAKGTYCSHDCMWASLSRKNSTARPWRDCAKCGKPFKPSRPNRRQVEAGYQQLHCGYECAGLTPRSTKVKRSKNEMALRRANKWGNVDPIKVFERDGWRCHMCGRKTPPNLRGTTDDRAPELDHIVTIAEGGEHSERNTACSCRRCNRRKGSRSMGQMRLFG